MEKKEAEKQPKLEPSKQEQPETGEELKDAELDDVSGGMGSQSTGAGAGKVTFNPFSINRK